MVVVEGIPQAVGDHAVDQLAMAHALAGTGRRHHVGGKAHVLLAAGDDYLGVTAADGLSGQVQCLQARTADLVQGHCRHAEGQAGLDRGLACRVLPGTGGKHLAEDDFVDLRRGQPGLFQQALDHGGTQVYCRHSGQGALEAADGGTGCGDDHHVVHVVVLRAMGVVPPASAGLAYLLSLFFFRIDVKSKSMGARRSNPPIWISSSHDPPAQTNSGFASL
ncbi:hypothetical protein D3C79_769210 [compost metagenome]